MRIWLAIAQHPTLHRSLSASQGHSWWLGGLGLAVISAVVLVPVETCAQQYTYSAGQMWGTTPGGVSVPGALDSSLAHATNGVVAGQVNSSKRGTLETDGTTSNRSISAIGSQTIVSNTIIGNNNISDIVATQSASNSGDVENHGQIVGQNSGSNTNN